MSKMFDNKSRASDCSSRNDRAEVKTNKTADCRVTRREGMGLGGWVVGGRDWRGITMRGCYMPV